MNFHIKEFNTLSEWLEEYSIFSFKSVFFKSWDVSIWGGAIVEDEQREKKRKKDEMRWWG